MEDWDDIVEMTPQQRRDKYGPVLSGEYGYLRGLGYYLWPKAHETLIEQPQRLARKVRDQLVSIHDKEPFNVNASCVALTFGILVGGIWFEEYRASTLAAVSAGLTGLLIGRQR